MIRSTVFRIILSAVILGISVVIFIGFKANLTGDNLQAWVNGFGLLAPLIFMGVYGISPIFFLPGSIFAITGGVLFGPVLGTFYNLTAATTGATLSFFIARYMASDWIRKKAGSRTKELMKGVSNEGWRFVAFVRLVPLFPFNLLNYILGLTNIRSYQYIITTFVCMVPGAFVYSYIGYAGREIVGRGERAISNGVLATGLLVALILLPGLVKRLSTAMRIGITTR